MSKVEVTVEDFSYSTQKCVVETEDIRADHIARFKRYAKQLNKLMDEMREYNPHANFYLANDVLHLMRGPSHTGHETHNEHSVASVIMTGADGGDW